MRPGGLGDPVSCALFLFMTTYSLWFLTVPPRAGGSGPPLLHGTPPHSGLLPGVVDRQGIRPNTLASHPTSLPSLSTAALLHDSPAYYGNVNRPGIRPNTLAPHPTSLPSLISTAAGPSAGRPSAPRFGPGLELNRPLNTAWMSEGFKNMMYPLVRNTPMGNPERP